MRFVRTAGGFIPCREVLDFLHAYLDDELAADERQEFDRHLAVCPSCVAYLETYRTTIALSREAFAEAGLHATAERDREPLAPPLPDDLMAAILALRG